MRDIITRIQETCTPRGPKRTPNTTPDYSGGVAATPAGSGTAAAPHPSSSLGAAHTTAAAEVAEKEDRGGSSGGGVRVDPLAALMAGVGGLGLDFGGAGGGGGSAEGLMAGLLGGDDVARLQQAVKGG